MQWQYLRPKLLFVCSVLKDPDSNPYSLLDNTESDQTVDTDASESHHSSNRRRRSRRRRTDEDAVLMDGMTESDTASVNENGLVTVADYISRAESQSRQRNPPKETLAKTKKETVRSFIFLPFLMCIFCFPHLLQQNSKGMLHLDCSHWTRTVFGLKNKSLKAKMAQSKQNCY